MQISEARTRTASAEATGNALAARGLGGNFALRGWSRV